MRNFQSNLYGVLTFLYIGFQERYLGDPEGVVIECHGDVGGGSITCWGRRRDLGQSLRAE